MIPLILAITLPTTENLILALIVGAISAVATFFATRHKTNKTVAQKEIDSIILANKELRTFITSQLNSLQIEYVVLEEKIKNYEAEIANLKEKIEEQAEIIKGYKQGKEAAEMKAEKLRGEVERLRSEVDELRRESHHDKAE